MDLRSAWQGFQAAWDVWRRTGSNTSWATLVAALDALHAAIDEVVDRDERAIRINIPPQLERRRSPMTVADGTKGMPRG